MEPLNQDAKLLEEFVAESEDLLQQVERDLVELEKSANEKSPENDEIVDRIFRALHTIKGTAAFLGLGPVTQLAHRAEDMLSKLQRGQIRFTHRTMKALLAASDELAEMLTDIRDGSLKEYQLDGLLAELESVQANQEPATGVRAEATKPRSVARSKLQPPQMIERDRHDGSSQPGAAAWGQIRAHSESLQTLRVEVRKLDDLANLISELVCEKNRVVQLARDSGLSLDDCYAGESPLSQSVSRLSVVVDELQRVGLSTRMVQLRTVLSKFPRLVRDLARSLGKEVDLVISGEDIELDKAVVEAISDPLVHLTRNSLDHGIELPEHRELAGKARRGTLRLEAKQEGGHILISVSDDGAGVDAANVLRSAIKRGLVSRKLAAELGDREILDLIFLPGFSTVETPTSVSGRGVGLDVVRSNLKKINGTIQVNNDPGRGTRFLLHLPPTLETLRLLLVQTGNEIYGLPLRSVVETSRVSRQDIHDFEGREVVSLKDETLPLVRLRDLLFADAERNTPSANEKVVMIASADTRYALLVDSLVGQESTVVKPLSSALNHCAGISGTTIGVDGTVRLVLDPSHLFKRSHSAARTEVVQ